MLHINEIALKEIATLTGVDEAKLKAELFVEAEKAPTETKVKDLFVESVLMKKADHLTLLDNHGKNKFDEGKLRANVDLTKAILGDKAFDVSKEMKREDIADKLKGILKTDFEAETGKEPNEKVKELNNSLEILRKTIGEKETEIAAIKGEFEKNKTFSTAKEKVIGAVSSINLEATGDVLNKQREVITKNILSSYEHKIEDGISVWYKDGNKLVDHLQNPKTIEDIAKEEAIIFPTTKASNGREDKSSNPNKNKSGSIDAELAKCETAFEVGKVLSQRGLSVINEDGRALLKAWSDARAKKA